MTEDATADLVFALNRPYFDLGPPLEPAPLNSIRPVLAYAALADEVNTIHQLQRSYTIAFRHSLAHQARRPEYNMTDPRRLPRKLWRPEWTRMCEACNEFPSLPTATQAKVLYLLHTLCLFSCAVELAHSVEAPDVRTAEGARLHYQHAMALYHLGPRRQRKALEILAEIAGQGPMESQSRFASIMTLLVHAAKREHDIGAAEDFRTMAGKWLAQAGDMFPVVQRQLNWSRFYRGASYVPLLRGDRVQVGEEMRLAEEHARRVQGLNWAEHAVIADNLYFVLESRAREAQLNGDIELAIFRLRQAKEVDRWDPRVRFELGELLARSRRWAAAADEFAQAARLGPPGTALAAHYLGFCHERLGEHENAKLAYLRAVDVDPLGLTNFKALAAPETEPPELRGWAATMTARLEGAAQ